MSGVSVIVGTKNTRVLRNCKRNCRWLTAVYSVEIIPAVFHRAKKNWNDPCIGRKSVDQSRWKVTFFFVPSPFYGPLKEDLRQRRSSQRSIKMSKQGPKWRSCSAKLFFSWTQRSGLIQRSTASKLEEISNYGDNYRFIAN